MNMKLALAAAAAIAVSGPAYAAVSLGPVVPGTNPYSGPTPTYNFNPGSQPTISGGAFVGPGTVPNSYAQPYGTDGLYYSVGPSTSEPGVIDLTSFGPISSISFIWGSVDSYNVLKVLADDLTTVLATYTGSNVALPPNGNQTGPNTNPLVTINFTGASQSQFGGLQLYSTGTNAFEIDNLKISAVPEPATWAMMILGFGLIGGALRRRQRQSVRYNFA